MQIMSIKEVRKEKKLLFLERVSKWIMLISGFCLIYCWYYKDVLPTPNFYLSSQLNDPKQTKTSHPSFTIETHDQSYMLTPLFDYELEGVVVTYNNAEQFGNIWHTKRWKDFINLKDLCVIWGKNVVDGIYQDMSFSSDSWTCWASAKDFATWQNFSMTQLSNNHVLIDNDEIKQKIMSTENGDQIRFAGMLVNYKNLNNNYQRNSSTVRTDTGNGACEVVYIASFEIIKKANKNIREWYKILKVVATLSTLSYFLLLCFTPKNSRRRQK